MRRWQRAGRTAALLGVMALSACAAQTSTHGWMPPEEELQQIVPGVDTRASVEDLIGVPTTSGVLNDSGFYYIETDTRTFAWQAPRITDRRILAITFDEAGIVRNIERYGLEDGRVVTLSRRVTETADGDIGFLRRLFGNIGGINAGQFFD